MQSWRWPLPPNNDQDLLQRGLEIRQHWLAGPIAERRRLINVSPQLVMTAPSLPLSARIAASIAELVHRPPQPGTKWIDLLPREFSPRVNWKITRYDDPRRKRSIVSWKESALVFGVIGAEAPTHLHVANINDLPDSLISPFEHPSLILATDPNLLGTDDPRAVDTKRLIYEEITGLVINVGKSRAVQVSSDSFFSSVTTLAPENINPLLRNGGYPEIEYAASPFGKLAPELQRPQANGINPVPSAPASPTTGTQRGDTTRR